MLKKYAPYIVLVAAGLLLYYVLNHQRGSAVKERVEVNTDAANTSNTLVNTSEGFNRHPAKIIYTKHAKCRLECRHITESEVKEILENGKLNPDKIQETDMGKTYPLDGKTSGDKMVRIVVAPKKDDVVIVTVIDLDTDWPCGSCD
jgi:Domain of unknown function (DUF4258)